MSTPEFQAHAAELDAALMKRVETVTRRFDDNIADMQDCLGKIDADLTSLNAQRVVLEPVMQTIRRDNDELPRRTAGLKAFVPFQLPRPRPWHVRFLYWVGWYKEPPPRSETWLAIDDWIERLGDDTDRLENARHEVQSQTSDAIRTAERAMTMHEYATAASAETPFPNCNLEGGFTALKELMRRFEAAENTRNGIG